VRSHPNGPSACRALVDPNVDLNGERTRCGNPEETRPSRAAIWVSARIPGCARLPVPPSGAEH